MTSGYNDICLPLHLALPPFQLEFFRLHGVVYLAETITDTRISSCWCLTTRHYRRDLSWYATHDWTPMCRVGILMLGNTFSLRLSLNLGLPFCPIHAFRPIFGFYVEDGDPLACRAAWLTLYTAATPPDATPIPNRVILAARASTYTLSIAPQTSWILG
jgi:hypothetical protein